MKSCYICNSPINTSHKSRVKCVKCGAQYRVLRNVKIIRNPKIYLTLKDKCPNCKIKGGLRFTRYSRNQILCEYCGEKFNKYAPKECGIY